MSANNSSDVYPLSLPLDQAHLMKPDTRREFAWKCLIFGVLASVGTVLNALSIFVLLKSRLFKRWTFGIVLNLSLADLTICVDCVTLYLPPMIVDW